MAPDRAFAVFTDGIDRWWTRAHHVQSGELKEIGVDPHVGGRMWVNPRRRGQRRWLAGRTAPICRRGLEAHTPRPVCSVSEHDEREAPTASRVPPSEHLLSHC